MKINIRVRLETAFRVVSAFISSKIASFFKKIERYDVVTETRHTIVNVIEDYYQIMFNIDTGQGVYSGLSATDKTAHREHYTKRIKELTYTLDQLSSLPN